MTDQANNEEVASEAAAERNARHKRAMERKKAYIDGNIAAATIDKGLKTLGLKQADPLPFLPAHH